MLFFPLVSYSIRETPTNPYLPAEKLLRQTCRLSAWIQEEWVPFCTATRISDHQLTTAAHCLYETSQYYHGISCPNEDSQVILEPEIINPNYIELRKEWEDRWGLKPFPAHKGEGVDVAIIQLKKRFRYPSLSLPSSKDVFLDLISNSTDCRTLGYAGDSDLHAVSVHLDIRRSGKLWPYLYEKELHFEEVTEPGDSGGTLVCFDKNKKPFLVGVIGGRSKGSYGWATSLFAHLESVKDVLIGKKWPLLFEPPVVVTPVDEDSPIRL